MIIMRKLSVLIGICFSIHCFAGSGTLPVNSVIGDNSFIVTFGHSPVPGTDEVLRIQTHLKFVEKILEEKDVSGLSDIQQQRRIEVIAHLHQYWTAGIFPSNFDFPMERRPCFIDKNGNICAVGYLIEQTAGREAAEQINAKHQYEYIFEMNEPMVTSWAYENGMSLEECGMIQPQYGPPISGDQTYYAEIKTGYGITSGVIGGINLATTIANFSHRSSNSNGMAHVGLVTGVTQIIMGAANIKKPDVDSYMMPTVNVSYKAQNNLSYLNIAMGTTTVVSSVMRLVMNKKLKDSRNTFNLYSYPNANNTLNVGLTVTRRI